MTGNRTATSHALWQALERRLPALSAEEQQVGATLHRELASAAPVTFARLAQELGTSTATAEALVRDSALSRFTHTDDNGRVLGFWGLSSVPTRHRLTVGGRTFWAWCAQDSLFLPELLGETAQIESQDPGTDQPIRLTVSPERVEAASPAGIVVSVGRPDTWDASSAPRLIATACHFILFFASRASAMRWQETNRDSETVLLSLDEAFALGKRSNARIFGAALARRATAA